MFEVLATNGDTHLGGDDWDAAIVEWLTEQIERDHGITVDEPPSTTERLFNAATQAKHDLSSRQQTRLTLPFLDIGGGTIDVEQTLTREMFESRTCDLTEQTITICEELFDDADLIPSTVDEVLLVGGATRMPQIQNHLATFIGQEPSQRVNPDEAVALGAAAQSAIINQQALPAPDTAADDMLARQSETNTPESWNAEEVVLLDVTPQSLGIEVVDVEQDFEKEYRVLIPRNSPIPARESDTGSTVVDDQKFVRIVVYQGEGTLEENELLDEYRIGPIPPRPVGEPEIKTTFQINQNGILQVSTEDIDHAIDDEIEIQSVFGLTSDEIDAMRRNLPAVQ